MTKEKLDKLFGWIAFLMLVIAVILTFSNTPIAKYINIWQAQINEGKYYPTLTVLLLLVPFIVIMLPLKLILQKRIKRNDTYLVKLNASAVGTHELDPFNSVASIYSNPVHNKINITPDYLMNKIEISDTASQLIKTVDANTKDDEINIFRTEHGSLHNKSDAWRKSTV